LTQTAQSIIADLEKTVADRLADWPPQWEGFHWPGYTYEHTQRVRNLALRLAREEGADLEVVGLAALLHDIAKAAGKDHAQVGAEEAAKLLDGQVPADLRERVCHAIATHSGDNHADSPVENKVLGDADLIDSNFGLVAGGTLTQVQLYDRTSHLKSDAQPSGMNIGYLDGHVDWRHFIPGWETPEYESADDIPKPRYGGDRRFWW